MGTVLSFRRTVAPYPGRDDAITFPGEVVIFPGVRIEREPGEPPASRDGGDGYDGVGGKRRPRQSS